MWMDIIKNIGLQQAGNCFICIGDILAGGDLQLLCTGSAFTAFLEYLYRMLIDFSGGFA